MIEIDRHLFIPEEELRFQASRSGGPGGQNVNKVSTRVMLLFDLQASPSLTPEQKTRIAQRLATRINKQGVLRVVCQSSRSQSANRDQAVERFSQLLREALEETPERKKTRVSEAEKRRRLEDKRKRAEIRKARRVPRDWDRDY